MYLIKTNSENPVLTALIAAIEEHQAAFKDFESAGRGLSNTAHPLEMRFWTKELEKALGNVEETAAIMLRRREALLTHMAYLLNARDAYNRIVEHTQHLKLVIAEAYAYLDSEKPQDADLIKNNLLAAIQEHDRKLPNLTTFDGPQGHLYGELNQALSTAFQQFLKQGSYCHHSGKINSILSLGGSAYPVSPAVASGKQTIVELRNLALPNKISQASFPSDVFATMESQLEELRLAWKNFFEFTNHQMRIENNKLGEDHYGLQLMKLASGELNAGYAESLPKQQNAKRLSYERMRTQFLALARELEGARRKVALSLGKAKEELQPLVSSEHTQHRRECSRSIHPVKPVITASRNQIQTGIYHCLYADLVLRDIGHRFKRSLEEYGTDISDGKGLAVLDKELKDLRQRYEVSIQMRKDLAKTNAARLKQEASAARDTNESAAGEKHFPPVQPPAGAITNVY